MVKKVQPDLLVLLEVLVLLVLLVNVVPLVPLVNEDLLVHLDLDTPVKWYKDQVRLPLHPLLHVLKVLQY
jgi:hypothetical protein